MGLTIRNAKIRKTGLSYVITIPKQFIENGLLYEHQTIDIEVTEK